MNQMGNEVSPRGIVLTDNVNMDWLKKLTPRYHPNFVKFVVNAETNTVCVGMDVHKDAQPLLADSEKPLYGGNIFFDGHIEYESTLNVDKNIRTAWFRKNPGNPRIINDPELIEIINAVLMAWVEL